jgi:hypothetical protein
MLGKRVEPIAARLVGMVLQEAQLYRTYQDWFAYGFFVFSKQCLRIEIRAKAAD